MLTLIMGWIFNFILIFVSMTIIEFFGNIFLYPTIWMFYFCSFYCFFSSIFNHSFNFFFLTKIFNIFSDIIIITLIIKTTSTPYFISTCFKFIIPNIITSVIIALMFHHFKLMTTILIKIIKAIITIFDIFFSSCSINSVWSLFCFSNFFSNILFWNCWCFRPIITPTVISYFMFEEFKIWMMIKRTLFHKIFENLIFMFKSKFHFLSLFHLSHFFIKFFLFS